jgi:hypothetical protein
MREHRRDRPRRVCAGRLTGAWCAILVVLGIGTTLADATSSQPGPVAPKVLAALNAGGSQFVTVRHGRSPISQQAAIRHALSAAPWRGCADGISLLRTMKRSTPSTPGTRVWLVSVHPTHRVLAAGGGPAHRPRSSRHGHAANYFVVAVTANQGRYVEAQAGYSRSLPRWTASQPARCSNG